jgi:hypothetical protein
MRSHALPVQKSADFGFPAKEDVLLDRHLFREIEFLVDQNDADFFGGAVGRKVYRSSCRRA